MTERLRKLKKMHLRLTSLLILSVIILECCQSSTQFVFSQSKSSNSTSSVEFFPTANANEWRKRSIYQLITDRFALSNHTRNHGIQHCQNLNDYCGGTFRGITRNLGHIKRMGFDAIWISPVPENDPHGYHGYWAKDIYKINHRFGSAQDLKQLVQIAHRLGLWVMIDVVVNHMGNNPDVRFYHPFNQMHHYHKFCLIKNYANQNEVEYCRIGDHAASLADLDTESNYVQTEMGKWVKWLVEEYGFDGVRIDTVKHVRKDFWPAFVRSAGVFSIGEVLHGSPAYVGAYQNFMDSLLNFPLYFSIRDIFGQRRESMWNLEMRWDQNRQYFRDLSVLGNFIDNHDFKRFLHQQKDLALFRNALVYMMMSQGIPILYQGTEFFFDGGDDPHNREIMWPYLEDTTTGKDGATLVYNRPNVVQILRKLNRVREIVGDSFHNSEQQHIWTNEDFHIFARGDHVLVATTNRGAGQSFDRRVRLQLKERMVNILDPSGKMELEQAPPSLNKHTFLNKFFNRFNANTEAVDEVLVPVRSGEPGIYVTRDLLLPYWDEFFNTSTL